MKKELFSVDVIQLNNEKTIDGLPKDLALRLGGLELSLTLNGLTAVADGDYSADQHEYIMQSMAVADELHGVMSKLIRLSKDSRFNNDESPEQGRLGTDESQT
ncbi:hypothetical protein [Levilactobacillus brevis]|uniref:hypothetical protein n=1 Tax=Levilactobacillus brevis TaxID=1580 RepID=UPI001BDDDA83|nr:hypothetical protein [Levilactobacillus brevis]